MRADTIEMLLSELGEWNERYVLAVAADRLESTVETRRLVREASSRTDELSRQLAAFVSGH